MMRSTIVLALSASLVVGQTVKLGAQTAELRGRINTAITQAKNNPVLQAKLKAISKWLDIAEATPAERHKLIRELGVTTAENHGYKEFTAAGKVRVRVPIATVDQIPPTEQDSECEWEGASGPCATQQEKDDALALAASMQAQADDLQNQINQAGGEEPHHGGPSVREDSCWLEATAVVIDMGGWVMSNYFLIEGAMAASITSAGLAPLIFAAVTAMAALLISGYFWFTCRFIKLADGEVLSWN